MNEEITTASDDLVAADCKLMQDSGCTDIQGQRYGDASLTSGYYEPRKERFYIARYQDMYMPFKLLAIDKLALPGRLAKARAFLVSHHPLGQMEIEAVLGSGGKSN